MSLYGYKPKGKPATWTKAFPNQMKTAIKQPTARRAPQPRAIRQSASQRAKLASYRKASVAFLARIENKLCFVCGKPASEVTPLHVHHVRGRVGLLLTDVRYFIPAHDFCHSWIHNCPAAARRRGLLAMPGEWGKAEK